MRCGAPFRTEDILEFDGLLRAGVPVLVLDDAGRALSVAQGEAAHAASGAETEADELNAPALVFKPLRVLAQ